ncbi:unnamed protein product, partial [Ilex paraguariensis]
ILIPFRFIGSPPSLKMPFLQKSPQHVVSMMIATIEIERTQLAQALVKGVSKPSK